MAFCALPGSIARPRVMATSRAIVKIETIHIVIMVDETLTSKTSSCLLMSVPGSSRQTACAAGSSRLPWMKQTGKAHAAAGSSLSKGGATNIAAMSTTRRMPSSNRM